MRRGLSKDDDEEEENTDFGSLETLRMNLCTPSIATSSNQSVKSEDRDSGKNWCGLCVSIPTPEDWFTTGLLGLSLANEKGFRGFPFSFYLVPSPSH